MHLHSGYIYIEGTGQEADYEFEHSEILNPMEQLTWLLDTGMLQIVDNAVEEIEDDE